MLLMHHIFETVPNEDLPGFSFFFSFLVHQSDRALGLNSALI